MTRHYLGLQDASVLATRDLLLTGRAVADLIESEAMGAVVGPAGLGKTFAIEHALASRDEQVITLTFEARPTMRLVADRLLHTLTGAPGSGTRFAMTDQLLNRLSDRRRLIVIGEAQNLNRDCFEYLRHLHDDPATRFALLFDGGDGCWEVLAREPMLRSRIYRRVAFASAERRRRARADPGLSPDLCRRRSGAAGADQRQGRQRAASLVGGVHTDRQPDLSRPRRRANRQGDRAQRDLPARHGTVSAVRCECEDDIATVKAIHALAARKPGVLAVSIVPGVRSETEVIWAILRALGKRIDQLAPNIKVWWIDAERWLTAHRINEIAVLCAQHLDQRTTDELRAHVCRRLGVALALIYGRPTRAAAQP